MSEVEPAEYEAGGQEMNAEEKIEGDIPRMLERRALIAKAEAKRTELPANIAKAQPRLIHAPCMI